METAQSSSPSFIVNLPDDELIRYGEQLGLTLTPGTPRGELLRRIRARNDLVDGLDRDALLDIIVWMRIPVQESATKQQLVHSIIGGTKVRFEGLSDRGLNALARLRGVSPSPNEPRASLEARLRKSEGFWKRLRRTRRSMVGALFAKLVQGDQDNGGGEYHFIPDDSERKAIKERIENQGVVSGIARTLRGVADDYVAEKLDEIEHRIDRKLDEIDQRLSEWRNREVANRLRIVKITLISTIIVVLMSLGYEYFKAKTTRVQTRMANSELRMTNENQ